MGVFIGLPHEGCVDQNADDETHYCTGLNDRSLTFSNSSHCIVLFYRQSTSYFFLLSNYFTFEHHKYCGRETKGGNFEGPLFLRAGVDQTSPTKS